VVKKVVNVEIPFFIAVEGRSRTVWEGWPTVIVQIQCFSFCLRGEVAGRSIAGR
jgi:hypothetical protein